MLGSLDYLAPGNIVFCPSRGVIAACERFGSIVERPVAEVLGARMADLTHPDDLKSNEWLLDRAIQTRRPLVLRKRYLLPRKTTRWVESRYMILETATRAPLVSMICRMVDEPSRPRDEPPAEPDRAFYIGEMSAQLALIARDMDMETTGDLFWLAARSARDEAPVV